MSVNYLKALRSVCEVVVDEMSERYADQNMKPLDEKKSFGFVPVKAFDFMVLAQVAYDYFKKTNKTQPKFVDAGCGPGFTLKMAEQIGYEAEGVENNTKHIEFAKRSNLTIHQGDITKYDFTPYDVFYAYVPLLKETFGNWTEKVLKAAKPDTIFISADMDWTWKYPKDCSFETIYMDNLKANDPAHCKGCVFKKVK